MAIVNRVDRDIFKDTELSTEEIARRLNLMIEQIYDVLNQLISEVENA